jgi:hypothetical protein
VKRNESRKDQQIMCVDLQQGKEEKTQQTRAGLFEISLVNETPIRLPA